MTSTRYVIMANGKGLRWGNFLGVPKHLITLEGETLLDRLVQQLIRWDPKGEVVISSSDHRSETVGARRHKPLNSALEIDRFVPELVTDRIVFLYGDTYYSEKAMQEIMEHAGREGEIAFFGDAERIVAVKSAAQEKLAFLLNDLRTRCLRGELGDCKGWQLFEAANGMDVKSGRVQEKILRSHPNYVFLEGYVWDFNRPEDLEGFQEQGKRA